MKKLKKTKNKGGHLSLERVLQRAREAAAAQDWPEAERAALQVITAARGGDARTELWAHATVAFARRRQGDLEGALEAAEWIIKGPGRQPADPDTADLVGLGYSEWVYCASELEVDPALVLSTIDAHERWMDAGGLHDGRNDLLLARAQAHLELGDHEAAVATARLAIELHTDDALYELSDAQQCLEQAQLDLERPGDAED